MTSADCVRSPDPGPVPRATTDPEFVRFVRSLGPALAGAINDEVVRALAATGPELGETFAVEVRSVIELAVAYFVDQLVDPDAARAELDEALRALGAREAFAGRKLESLTAALRVGTCVAREHVAAGMRYRARPGIEIQEVIRAVGAVVESLAAQADLGYRMARRQLADADQAWRDRLLELVLLGDRAVPGELAEHAARGSWGLPDRVVLVAVEPARDEQLPPARALRPGVLARVRSPRPVVLLPGPVTGAIRAIFAAQFRAHRIAFGAPVSLADAAASFRWAHRALDLARDGILPATPVIDCEDHVGELWIHSEPLLVEIIDRTLLAAFYDEPPYSRQILGETLLAWIESRGASAPALAAMLDKHPQTVRYRLRRLRSLFGSTLDDPVRINEIHYALRAGSIRWRSDDKTN